MERNIWESLRMTLDMEREFTTGSTEIGIITDNL